MDLPVGLFTTFENIPASLPRAQEDGRSVAVAESSAPGLGNAGLERVCATCLLLPGARRRGRPGVAGDPVMGSRSERHSLHDRIAGLHTNFFSPSWTTASFSSQADLDAPTQRLTFN